MTVCVDDARVAIVWAKLLRISRAAMGRFLLLGVAVGWSAVTDTPQRKRRGRLLSGGDCANQEGTKIRGGGPSVARTASRFVLPQRTVGMPLISQQTSEDCPLPRLSGVDHIRSARLAQ